MRVVATAGHVDHGKSSIVRALTGTDPDRLAEEQQRGMTIDLGFAHTELSAGHRISFVDVPGHVRFLGNMLAGVSEVDACLFVVDAREGWKPQSEEHLRILQLLGMRHGVVALSKVDLVDDDWRMLQELDVRERVAGTFLADAPIVAVSTVRANGLAALSEALVQLLRTTPAAADRHRPRLWIDRVFAPRGSGTVVTGTLAGGSIEVDDQLHVGDHPVRVRGIQAHGNAIDQIGPGNRVALNLAGIEHTAVHRGDAVVQAAQWRATDRLDASLTVLAALRHQVSRRGAYVVHIGSAEVPVALRVLGTDSLASGATGNVRLSLARSLPLLPGDRYVLRESGRAETIGGGEVLDIAPRRPAASARPDRSPMRVVAEHGWIDADELEALTGHRLAPTIGRWVVDGETLAAARAALRAQLDSATSLGVELATLDERERALVALFGDVILDGMRVRTVSAPDPLAEHPFVAAAAAGGFAPPDAVGVERSQLRELIRRGLLVERDGIVFHPSAVEDAAVIAARLLTAQPAGFTMAQFRDALDVTRKHALPLANELDARAVTRRRGDLRVAGPRLPG